MRALLLSFSLLLATAASADIWLEPVDPTTNDAIFLNVAQSWPHGCVPQDPVVTRRGNSIEVLWREPGGGCTAAVTAWRDRVGLGMFEAGVYEVVPRVRLQSGDIRTLPSRTLIVRHANLPFTMTPGYASTRGGEVTFSSEELCEASRRVAIRIDGVEAPIRRAFCTAVATVPPHARGVATVTFTIDDTVQTFRAALRYVDPDAAPDPAVAERILVPILYNGPGAFDSRWVTEATVTNRDEGVGRRFEWYPFRPCSGALCGNGVDWLQTASLSAMFGQRPNGLLLFVERQPIADDLHFGSVIREVSRSASSGTEVPIVREKNFRTGYTLFPNVLFDPNSRVLLRLYGVDGALERVWVDVHFPGRSPEAVMIEALPSPCPSAPCNSDQPAFAAIDLTARYGRITGTNSVRANVAVRPNDGWNVQRYWAFVSVTHNETQHVTVITPQN